MRRPAPPPPRRGRTLGLLLTPLVGLVIMIAGVWLLQEVHPDLDRDLAIEQLPALALDEVTTCTRQGSPTVIEGLRAEVPAGGRLTSRQVVSCPAAWDGLEITYVGEVVGEVLDRDDGAWAQINDDPYALEVGPLLAPRQREGANTGLAVWLPDELRDQVEVVGRAETRGDVVAVRGMVHRTDPNDGGGLTIRANDLRMIAEGETLAAPLHVPQAVTAVVLAALAAGCGVWAWRVRRG